jgi:hypothetical protein
MKLITAKAVNHPASALPGTAPWLGLATGAFGRARGDSYFVVALRTVCGNSGIRFINSKVLSASWAIKLDVHGDSTPRGTF